MTWGAQILPRAWQVITDDEIARIRDGAARILAGHGFRIQNRAILEHLAKKGFRVDYAACAVYPTRKQIEDVEAAARRRPDTQVEPLLRRPLPSGQWVGHNYTCYYDWTEGARRPALLQDIRNVARAWHTLPEIIHTGPCMTAQDAPAPIEPIVSAVETMKLTNKIQHCPELMQAAQLPYMEELETIMQNKQARYHTNGCSVTRFTIDERAAECLLAVARNGLERWWINSCPVAGANAPVTLAGAAVIGVAEILGGWLAGWALNEDVKLSAIPLAGTMDMRTSRISFSTPESILIDCALYQYFHRMYGLRIGLCIGYTDAELPGMQAVNDKMLKSLAYGLFTEHIGGQAGTLQAGNIYSPTQQVLDLEMNRQIAQLSRGFDVSDTTLALDVIERYLDGAAGSFLDMDHTLEHWRETLWFPRLLDRIPPENADAARDYDRRILDRAEAYWRDALASYTPPDLDEAKLKAAEDVAARARAALL